MKIAFIGQKGIPAVSGGVEKHVEDLSILLAARGHEVMVYTRPAYTEPALSEHRGVRLISTRGIVSKHLDAISHTCTALWDLRRRNVDIIHFHAIGPSSLILLARVLQPRARIVFTFHCQDYYHKKWGLFARSYLKFGEMVACRLADMTIAVSHCLSSYVRRRYNGKAIYIPNGVHEVVAEGAKTIKQWNLERGNYILAVSRLIRHKGIHHLIKAFQTLATDKKLVITGSGAYTDDYVMELRALAAGDDRIIFTGSQTSQALDELFANAYLFVHPSHSEGLSIALLEAMSFGIAPLVSNIPENLEAIGKTGFSFVSKDEVDLARSLEMLLADEMAVKAAGSASRERVRREYNWETIGQHTEAVYEEVIHGAWERNRRRSLLTSRILTLF